MDPASAIIGFVTTGIQVVKLAKDTLDDIKDAPKKLQALRDRVADTEILLKGLESRRLDGLFESKEDIEALERAGKKAKACIDEISLFTSKVQRINKDGGLGVKKVKWILEGGTLKNVLGQLGELEDALKAVVNLAILRTQSRQEESQARQEESLLVLIEEIRSRQPIGSYGIRHPPTVPNSRAYFTPSDKLSCPSDCACRCHSLLLKPVIPEPVVPYIGQIFVPKRMLHVIGASSWECNVQTCRRDRQTSHRLTWAARWWYLTISVSSCSFTASLHAPRVIPRHAPVWGPLNRCDVDALQALFVAGEVTVYDVSEYGQTLFEYAVRQWARNRSEGAIKVIRFLKDAGVDPEFIVDPELSVAALVSDASLATLIEHPTSNFLHAVRTSSVAVDICRSILGMDVVDILEDFLSHPARHEAAQMLFGQPSEGGPADLTVNAEAMVQACGWPDMLTYSMRNMPEDATLRLIQGGIEIPGQCLPTAVTLRQINVVEALLVAGADANGRDSFGYTALHWACRNLNLDVLELLVAVAGEDIDWNARTPEGENVLQIAKRMQLVLSRSSLELARIFDILYAHAPDVDEEEDLEDWENTSYAIPGAFPSSGSR